MLYTVTNGSRHPRVIYAAGRGVLVPMGASRPVEMTEAEAENAAAPGITIAAASAEPGPIKVDLSGAGGDIGVLIAAAIAIKDGPFMAFKSAATKILGPGAPTTKAEIIAALEEKAKA